MRMGKVSLKFKRLICFFIAIFLIFCFDKNNYLHQVMADNETHEFTISPVKKTYTITQTFNDTSYSIPKNNYTLDLSNTSKNSPAEITEFIYQTKLKIEPNTTNNATITNIEALDVNEKAVTITSSNDDNSYTLEFNSFFYDNVVFEITDSENEKYYLKINRYAAIISTNFDNIDDPTPTTKKIFANLYVDYKEDAGSEVINLETIV